ncbi:MAG TPA: hypothetical protein VEA80_17515 [Vitreimonas sp.]|uniref:hypothetical protein n=1 Tax=Vitreimonas sp. TaxID=3069702 RepID=UPI002D3B4386|nr:hypothetical protein [Vitreimonas sp.]HYD89281.1 hypothetical protein [Vitreimonas sp.]
MLTRQSGRMGAPGRNRDPDRVAAAAAEFSLMPLDQAGIAEARALAAALIGQGIAETADFVAVQRVFPASVFGIRENGRLTGVLAAFPLNRMGLKTVEQDCFDAVRLDSRLVAAAGEDPAAYYGWGFAATSKDGARAVMKTCVAIHRNLYFATPTFARAVTSDGVRALQSIGFRLLEGREDLFAIAPAPAAPELTRP